MTLAPWLQAHLIAKGVMSQSGLTRRAKIHTHRCGLPCLAGYDNDWAAMDAWCELQAINAQGEAEALLEGRATYNYSIIGQQIYPRWHWHIAGEPAGTMPRIRVLVEHRCDTPIPAHWADPQDDHQPATPKESDECPF